MKDRVGVPITKDRVVPMVVSGIRLHLCRRGGFTLFLVDERPTNDFDWLIEDPGPVLSVFGKDEKQTRQSKNDSFFDCRIYFRLRGFLISGNLAFSGSERMHRGDRSVT